MPVYSLAVALLAVAAPAWGEPIAIEARPVPLNPEDATASTVGSLRFRGGIVLTSPDPRFGGLSALAVGADGRELVAIGDTGLRFAARLAYDRRGNLADALDGDLAPLLDPDGQPLAGKAESDAEAMAAAGGGDLIVAFERRHRIWRYPAGGAAPTALPSPPGLDNAPANGGIEALTRLEDGRLLALTEDLRDGVDIMGWLGGDGGWSALAYVPEGDFRPTGAATLPGGDLLVLERAYGPLSGFAARLVRLAKSAVGPGARLRGVEVAVIAAPLTVDNFEGVDARRGESGETLIYLVSDDNLSSLQRTLLMMFELIR